MTGQLTKQLDKSNEILWRSRFADPAFVASKAFKILKEAEKANHLKGIAYARLNLAAANFFQSKNDKSLKYLSEAVNWFENNQKEKGYVRTLLLRGNIFESFGDYEKTLSLWLEAYKISVEVNDLESEGEACSQLGLIYYRLHNYQKALEYFNKGLKIREDLKDENAVASSLNRIGMVLCQQGDYEESLRYYFRSLDIRIKNRQNSAIPWTLLGIATVYEDKKNYNESLDYYDKAMNGGDQRCILQCLMGSGRILSRMGESEKALNRLEGSLKLAQDLKSMSLIAEAYKALANHYEHFNDPANALQTYKQYLKAKESFQSTEVQSRLSNIEVAYAIERSEHEKEIFRLRHVELKKAYDIIEEKNKNITASINYAKRIQNAMLPHQGEISGPSGTSFILYLPKDIVSGDFYWFTGTDGKIIFAAGDCTGHGVPGALMSMLGISFLEEIVNNRKITDPGLILDELSHKVRNALHQSGGCEEAKDGMDLSLCVIDQKKKLISYAGAYNNMYLIRDHELYEYPADRMPVGIHHSAVRKFTQHDIEMLKGDMIYMFSDGYADQFGGKEMKKFKYSAFRKLLLEIHDKPVKDQKKNLESEFHKWKGDNPQTDDVVVMGIRI